MENNNNNNGRGIFYGVIGVATLVVAIIGATFAFFAASTNSATNAITAASSTAGNLTLTQVTTGLKTNLIPVNETLGGFKSAVGLAANKCVDTVGNNICSVYQFTVTNGSAQAQSAYFYFTPSSNSFTNLHYAVFKGTPSSYDVTGTAVKDSGTATAAGNAAAGALVIGDTALVSGNTTRQEWTNLTQLLAANGGSATYTVVLWVHETGNDQTSADAGKAFAAGVTITTGSMNATGQATSGITGVLAA